MRANRKIFPIIILAIIAVTAIIANKHYQPNQPITNLNQPQLPSPTFISKTVPVEIDLKRGSITSISGNNITLNAQGVSKTYSISNTEVFQKVVSGTIEGGDAKTATSSAKELKVGQEVLVVTDLNSTSATSVYIIK